MKTNQKKSQSRAFAVRSRSAKDIWQCLTCDYGRQRSRLGTWHRGVAAGLGHLGVSVPCGSGAGGRQRHMACAVRVVGGRTATRTARHQGSAWQRGAARQPSLAHGSEHCTVERGRRTAVWLPSRLHQAHGRAGVAVRVTAVPPLPSGAGR